jgi:Na+/phosphate symporter
MTNDPREGDLQTTVIEPPTLSSADRPFDAYMNSARSVLSRISFRKIGLFMISLILFILALTLMKEGARGLTPLVEGRFAIQSPANALGFGWLFAYVIMSGSPVAASALTFFDAGIINQLSAFTMISGSRLGSSFIVLFIGFIYVLRGRNRGTSLSMGLLSFIVTGTIHAGVLVFGYFALRAGLLNRFQPGQGAVLNAITDLILDPVVNLAKTYLPDWGLFVGGLVLIMITFSLFDKCLPEMALKESQIGRVSRLVYKPAVMFLLGAAITLISMSVSVSLSILVPLSHRGFIRRENVIPYIMGANITTFIDTLLAAALLNNPQAVTVVMTQMVGVMLVSLVILLLVFRPYERIVLKLVNRITRSNVSMALFMVTILVIPLVLMFIG